jgi:hypothetical protein
MESRNDADDADDGPYGFRWSVGSVAAILVVVAIAAFWVYAFSPWAPDDKADGLQDRSFVETANARCRTTMDQLNALPPARDAENPTARAEVVDESNVLLTSMVADLRTAGADAVGRDRTLLDLWFADWDAYIVARARYADNLRASGDKGAVFTVPARNGGQITQTMEGFIKANEIYDCAVPEDV